MILSLFLPKICETETKRKPGDHHTTSTTVIRCGLLSSDCLSLSIPDVLDDPEVQSKTIFLDEDPSVWGRLGVGKRVCGKEGRREEGREAGP